MKVKYIIYNPAGNITALIIGDKYTAEQKRIINNEIMMKEPKVEQVGFLSKEDIKLTMAGGEFCGNATRCAVSYYIKKQKSLEIQINNQKLQAGMDENENIWCEIPIEKYEIVKLDKNVYKVVLKGITIIVVKNIEENKDLKQKAQEIIICYNVDDEAVGVMFANEIKEYIEIYPVVWVKSINTLFLENACGSGTIGVTMLETYLTKKSNKYSIKQPSEEFLDTEITIKNNIITKAILKGKIKTDNKIKEIIIS